MLHRHDIIEHRFNCDMPHCGYRDRLFFREEKDALPDGWAGVSRNDPFFGGPPELTLCPQHAQHADLLNLVFRRLAPARDAEELELRHAPRTP